MKARTARRRRAYRYTRECMAKYPPPDPLTFPFPYHFSTAARRRYLDAIGFIVPRTGKARRGRR